MAEEPLPLLDQLVAALKEVSENVSQLREEVHIISEQTSKLNEALQEFFKYAEEKGLAWRAK
jgi:uncharacterized protein YoxC